MFSRLFVRVSGKVALASRLCETRPKAVVHACRMVVVLSC
jgi:hypothetical protein